jgi:hypothetical protein
MNTYPHSIIAVAAFALAAFTLHAQQPDAKRPLTNGDFNGSPGKLPVGWLAAYHTGMAAVSNDGKDTFLRLSNAQPDNAGAAQEIGVPTKATTVSVMGRMRGKPRNEKDEKRAAVEVCLRYKDAAGGNMSAAVVASKNSPNWHTFKRTFTLPPGCTKVEVVARSIFAVGVFDFDEVRVEFK